MRPQALDPRRRALVRAFLLPVLAAAVLVSAAPRRPALAQQVDGFERGRWKDALNVIKDDIKKNYYDPNFHGIDLDAHFKKAEEKMKQAQSIGQLFGIIAQALLDFDDSHLFFLPPGRASRFDYGWRTQVIGDRCFVTAVKPGSDAEAKGLKPGDEVVGLDGYQITRGNHWKMQYAYFSLRPVPGVRFVVAGVDGQQRQLDVMTKITQRKRVVDLTGGDINEFLRDMEDDDRERRAASRALSFGDQVMLWKFEEFAHTDDEIDGMMAKARKHKALVIDLRGNGGGAEKTLLRMLSNLFDRDVNVGEIKRRKETKPLTAKTRGGDNVFKGDLVVLVDSGSGSASELFARVIQLEKRGTVMGDRSAGAVMRSRHYPHELGMDVIAPYGVSVTDADIVMTDGKSLEHVGVQPDVVLLPKAADLAAGRDPVLAQAVTLAGFPLDAEKAGALFPMKWKK
ncbi:MAG TPA: S41 family peptidase [Pyrinomonadaceae bacterium]|jgi:C-terminal processing protease CtpA/Prc